MTTATTLICAVLFATFCDSSPSWHAGTLGIVWVCLFFVGVPPIHGNELIGHDSPVDIESQRYPISSSIYWYIYTIFFYIYICNLLNLLVKNGTYMHIYIIISYIYIIFGIFEGGIKSLITSSMWLEHLPLNAHGTSTYVTPWAMHLGTTGDGGFKCWNTIEPSGFNVWWYQFWLYPLVI